MSKKTNVNSLPTSSVSKLFVKVRFQLFSIIQCDVSIVASSVQGVYIRFPVVCLLHTPCISKPNDEIHQQVINVNSSATCENI